MKLKNKKTGEIAELIEYGTPVEDGRVIFRFKGQIGLFKKTYNSLAELDEEWEDVPEEPKKYYYITSCGETTHRGYRLWENESIYDKNRKQIGNYFETREEAKRAVEKLKAFKRLKDKGFRFEGWDNTDRSTIHNFSLFVAIEDLESINKDLDLLFSGEDD